jgi:hypothetical protein
MKTLPILITLLSLDAWADEFGWKCSDGSIKVAHVKPCPGGVPLRLDDMTAAELNAYTKAFSEKERKDELERKTTDLRRQASEFRRQVEEDLNNPERYRLCARFSGYPSIGMTEEQFLACSGKGAPTSKNYTTTAHGRSVQYVYKSGSYYRFYYFKDGVLSAIQE